MIEQTETTYAWRGRHPSGVTAQDAGETLAAIEARDGHVTTMAVVDEARPKTSPIHPAFEWRDKVAAEEHRKWQARQLIRSVRIISTNAEGESTDQPAMIHVKAESKGQENAYHAAARVISDLDLFQRAMTEAETKVLSAKRTVLELKDLAEQTDQRDKLRAISIVASSLATAAQALGTIH